MEFKAARLPTSHSMPFPSSISPALAKCGSVVDLLMLVYGVLAKQNGTADLDSTVIRVRGELWEGKGRKQLLPVIRVPSFGRGPQRAGGVWQMPCLSLERTFLGAQPARSLLDSGV